MRLSEEEIKAAILDPDPDVRYAAVRYFAEASSRDPAVMPLVISAFEQYGREAFRAYSFLSELQQTADSVGWLCRQIATTVEDPANSELLNGCIAAIIDADPEALQPHESEIMSFDRIGPDAHEWIAKCIGLALLSTDDLWSELTRTAATIDAIKEAIESETDDDMDLSDDEMELSYDEMELADELDLANDELEPADDEIELTDDELELTDDELELTDDDLESADEWQQLEEAESLGFAIADVIAGRPEDCTNRVVELLTRNEGWLTLGAAHIAARCKLEAAVPHLIELIDIDDWSPIWADLVRTGSDRAVAWLVETYDAGEEDRQAEIVRMLGHMHTDRSVEALLSILGREHESHLRSVLIQTVASNFASEGIDFGREYVRKNEDPCMALDVRWAVERAATVMKIEFPELKEWREEDRAFEERWRAGKAETLLSLARQFGDLGEPPPVDEFGTPFDNMPPAPIVNRQQRVGRNDPCPCGSGKKYKKCCYRKDMQDREQNDQPLVMNRSEVAPPKYPIGTIIHYGPDDKTTTKVVAGAIPFEGADADVKRFVGTNVKHDPKIREQIDEFFESHGVRSVVKIEANMGCPHEEGKDFPEGEDCPFCPFWAGRQGTKAGETATSLGLPLKSSRFSALTKGLEIKDFRR